MPRFTAHYRCARCGASVTKTISAPDNRRAIDKLPRYTLVLMLDCDKTDDCKFRRNGGIFKQGD